MFRAVSGAGTEPERRPRWACHPTPHCPASRAGLTCTPSSPLASSSRSQQSFPSCPKSLSRPRFPQVPLPALSSSPATPRAFLGTAALGCAARVYLPGSHRSWPSRALGLIFPGSSVTTSLQMTCEMTHGSRVWWPSLVCEAMAGMWEIISQSPRVSQEPGRLAVHPSLDR